jgi:hypothetical protein
LADKRLAIEHTIIGRPGLCAATLTVVTAAAGHPATPSNPREPAFCAARLPGMKGSSGIAAAFPIAVVLPGESPGRRPVVEMPHGTQDVRHTGETSGGLQMSARAYQRRAVLRGTALTVAGTTAGIVAAQSVAADAAPSALTTPVGPWTYVAPGESISAAINGGARAILLGNGEYRITTPIVLPRGCHLRGIGQLTRLRATTSTAAVIAIGNGAAVDGVCVSDLVVDCDRRATDGIDVNIVGTTGNFQGEPDAVCRLDNIWVYSPTVDGVVYRGSDTQAVVTSRVRVRQAGRYGFRVEAPDNWWIACEATTIVQTGSSAGFYIGGANNFFNSCKAWYCRDYGFHVKGTRNKFVGCEAQDIRSHGWYIEWDKNTFTGCTCDTAGMTDVGGTANTADGFYVVSGTYTSIVGCQAFDRRPGGGTAQQRYGFNVPVSMVTEGRLVGHSGWDNIAGLVSRR